MMKDKDHQEFIDSFKGIVKSIHFNRYSKSTQSISKEEFKK